MNNKETIQHIVNLIKVKFEKEGSGHDWWHIYRVWQTSITIARQEKANLFVTELGALLHDVADWKFHNGDENAGGRETEKILNSLSINMATVNAVKDIVNQISYKGAGVKTPMNSLEGMIVQDADRLDAIGAIGIARTFAYGGYKSREIYNPQVKPHLHQSFEEYKNSTAPTINHFYEKLLLLKDRMNTPTGKEMAIQRHQFMETYLDHFFAEWDGSK